MSIRPALNAPVDDGQCASMAYPAIGSPFDDGPRTLSRLATHWAANRAEDRAFVFLGEQGEERESLTYSELDRKACDLARRLSGLTRPGDRALLMFPPGLAFIVAFFACHHAGIIPVPVVPVRARRMRDASRSVAVDCAPTLVLAPADYEAAVRSDLYNSQFPSHSHFIALDLAVSDPCEIEPPADALRQTCVDDLAFLQYTSGSTSAPKGVAVTQGNLFANLEMQRRAFAHPLHAVAVGWAPHYHDMGLICQILEPFYLGGLAVLMAPGTFAQAPWLWLRAIATYHARISGGPNFAYELCLARAGRIMQEAPNLSHWEVAFNSAEPVRADTLQRFTQVFAPLGLRAESMNPAYGMAEATLLISAGTVVRKPIVEHVSRASLANGVATIAGCLDDAQAIVGCGRAMDNEKIVIVDPANGKLLADGHVGEIWVHGPHVPAEYWNRTEQSLQVFNAYIADDVTGTRYLRTGDLGYLRDGELFITGRLKDVLIIRGRNIYPNDIEHIAELAYPGLKMNSGAAFVVSDPEDRTEQCVLVQEVERTIRRNMDSAAAVSAIRRAVLQEFELTLDEVVLVDPGSIPKTSSGKIRRAETRAQFVADALARIEGERAKVGEVDFFRAP